MAMVILSMNGTSSPPVWMFPAIETGQTMGPMFNITTASTATNATSIWPHVGATNATMPTTSTCATYVSQLFVSELVIDEEDYVNHRDYYELARARGVAFRIRTAEERRRADEELARQRAAAEAARREREAAELRSRELLFRHLTAEQRRTVENNKWFVVIGGNSGTRYRIRTDYGVAGNISVMRGDRTEATLCCHCGSDIPAHDQFLAQKLALMWDEDEFLRTANRRAA